MKLVFFRLLCGLALWLARDLMGRHHATRRAGTSAPAEIPAGPRGTLTWNGVSWDVEWWDLNTGIGYVTVEVEIENAGNWFTDTVNDFMDVGREHGTGSVPAVSNSGRFRCFFNTFPGQYIYSNEVVI